MSSAGIDLVRVVEAAGFYFPDSVGGTEVYVDSLARKLQARGIECVVAAPIVANKLSHYVHGGIDVYRYPFPERSTRSEAQGRIAPRHFDIFETWLRQQNADIYHQHSWTTGCGLWHLEAAKQIGLKTVVTLHVPTSVCIRGTMLYEGRRACDGQIIPKRCGSCWLQSKSVPVAAARFLAALPETPLVRLPWLGPALSVQNVVGNHRNNLLRLFSAADRVVVVCAWFGSALLANGMPSHKIVLSRQGVDCNESLNTTSRVKVPSNVFRFGFIGRWDPVKGLHILVDAFKQLTKDLPVELYCNCRRCWQ